MVVEYGKLDARYWPTKDPLVMMISYVELAIMGPLCILWYAVYLVIEFYFQVNTVSVSKAGISQEILF